MVQDLSNSSMIGIPQEGQAPISGVKFHRTVPLNIKGPGGSELNSVVPVLRGGLFGTAR